MNCDNLVDQIDYDTQKYRCTTPIFLYGSEDSRFLKGIRAKANKFGFNATITDEPMKMYGSYVIDYETYHKTQPKYYTHCDLDKSAPAVTEAIYRVLKATGFISGRDITIVGRGKAVRELPDMLLHEDATVTVCHSKTLDVGYKILCSDAVILATPKLSEIDSLHRPAMVIDISGVAENENIENYISSRDIGRLTTAILLNRYVHRFGGIKNEIQK